MKDIIQVTNSSMPEFNEYVEEIKELWQSHWITNMGVKHLKLEEELIEYLKTSNIALFSNGHLALESAIEALQLTGEVITTPFTFASTTHAIVRKGLKPVFCDIEDKNYTIDTEKIEKLITDKTSAIIPVHVYGNVCNIYEIETIAKKYNLKVIYDAAHAFGITINEKGISNYGDASIFSFHATKVFNTIEGGAVTFKDNNLKRILDNIKNFGITGPETVDFIGGNAKLNEFQAAMGICNLRHVDKDILKRKIIAERYIEHLDGLKGIKICKTDKNISSNYSYFPVVFEGYLNHRDNVYESLKKCNIFARKYFYPLTSSFNCYKGQFVPEETPVANYISNRILCLPIYPELSLDDVDRICKIIKEQ